MTRKSDPAPVRCKHTKAKTIGTNLDKWCRDCGALYCSIPKIGWTWLYPNIAVGLANLPVKE